MPLIDILVTFDCGYQMRFRVKCIWSNERTIQFPALFDDGMRLVTLQDDYVREIAYLGDT
jgi:hypothetical protein